MSGSGLAGIAADFNAFGAAFEAAINHDRASRVMQLGELTATDRLHQLDQELVSRMKRFVKTCISSAEQARYEERRMRGIDPGPFDQTVSCNAATLYRLVELAERGLTAVDAEHKTHTEAVEGIRKMVADAGGEPDDAVLHYGGPR